MKIFASTAGFGKSNFYHAALELLKVGFKNIEVSSGKYVSSPSLLLHSLGQDCELMIHNYFPVPSRPFVLNLSSDDSEILSRSINLAKKAISLSAGLGLKYYGVHSGFRANLRVQDLGQSKIRHRLISRKKANSIFKKSISELGKYASKNDVMLLVENNVLGNENFKLFGTNPFLMVEPGEIQETIRDLDCEVKLLLDLAHLKISSHTLGFSVEEAVLSLEPDTRGYQASLNDGLEDSGLPFDEHAWFVPLIDVSKDFLTLEFSSSNPIDYWSVHEKMVNHFK